MSTTNTAIIVRAPVGATWMIDSTHSSIEYSERHMMIATVRGAFQYVHGTILWDGEHLENAAVEARIDTWSIMTHNPMRDDHLRSGDVFLAERWPTITFASTSIEPTGRDQFVMYGDLTIRDRMCPVAIAVEYQGQISDGEGKQRAAFMGTTSLSRKDFGIRWNQRLDGGGVVVSDTVKVVLHISAVRQS